MIRRKLISESNKILVAGKNTGAGIVMSPKTGVAQNICAESEGSVDCVPDNVEPQWAFTEYVFYPFQFEFHGTYIQYGPGYFVAPDVHIGGLFDLSKPVSSRANFCCSQITWDVAITGSGSIVFEYYFIYGMIIIRSIWNINGENTLTATPSLCGVELTPLVLHVIAQ